jgi:hypothetical protein
MANGEDPDYRDFKIGELNSLGFEADDLLISNGATGTELLKQALNKAYERTSTFNNKLMRAEVLLAREVPRAGPGFMATFLDNIGVTTQRQYAICRIPEIDACIAKPDINRVAEGDISARDKMLLSMHGKYYTNPNGEWIHGQLYSGDIVLVDNEGIIISLEEKSPFSPPDRNTSSTSAVGAFTRATVSYAASFFEGGGETACQDYDENMEIPNKSAHSSILNNLHPEFRDLVKKFICACWDQKGISITLNSGHRTPEYQAQLYEEWAECAQRGGSNCGPRPSSSVSHHNYGMAIDFNPKLANGTTILSASSKNMWLQSGIPDIISSLGLKWGGDWQNPYDPIHIQYPKWSMDELQAGVHLESDGSSTAVA